MVAMHHASDILHQARYGGVSPFWDFMKEFDVGVDFFFVLSGFIITWVHFKDIGKINRLTDYLIRRVTRIYPPYWCILAPLVILYFLFPHSGTPSQHAPVNIFLSFFLLPNPQQPVLGVAWTLVYEMFFYTLFAMVIAIGHRGWLMFQCWAIAILILCAAGHSSTWPGSFFFDTRNLEFLFGVVIARFLAGSNLPAPGSFVVGGALLFSSGMLIKFLIVDELAPVYDNILFGLASAAMIAGLVELERTGRIAFGRSARLLGSGSYSIYLVHSVIQSWVLIGAWRFLGWMPPDMVWAFIVSIGIGSGLIFHVYVERLTTDIARRCLSHRPSFAAPIK